MKSWINAGYEYKGYRYDPFDDVEPEECCKTFHDVICPDGTRDSMDWSPYSAPTEEQYKLWIELGRPRRISGGPLDARDLENILLGKWVEGPR